nr:MAG TPA: hypothetical protein [Bacteriophage sp.]
MRNHSLFNTFKTMKDTKYIIDELFEDFYASAEIAALNECANSQIIQY